MKNYTPVLASNEPIATRWLVGRLLTCAAVLAVWAVATFLILPPLGAIVLALIIPAWLGLYLRDWSLLGYSPSVDMVLSALVGVAIGYLSFVFSSDVKPEPLPTLFVAVAWAVPVGLLAIKCLHGPDSRT